LAQINLAHMIWLKKGDTKLAWLAQKIAYINSLL